MIKRGREDGFTLIELAIVCMVIGILVSIAVPNYARTRTRAFRAACVSNQKNLHDAATLYVIDQGLSDVVFNSETLYDDGVVTERLTVCPENTNVEHDDYEITVVGGRVTDIRCAVAPDEHRWRP